MSAPTIAAWRSVAARLSFHATDDSGAGVATIRALIEKYRKIESSDWVDTPTGSVQMMALDDSR